MGMELELSDTYGEQAAGGKPNVDTDEKQDASTAAIMIHPSNDDDDDDDDYDTGMGLGLG